MRQVPDEDLVDRVAGRRLDPETGEIYHLKHKPPPEDVKDRLIQRSDDTAEKVETRLQSHHSNVDAVLGYYQDVLVEVGKVVIFSPFLCKPCNIARSCQTFSSTHFCLRLVFCVVLPKRRKAQFCISASSANI